MPFINIYFSYVNILYIGFFIPAIKTLYFFASENERPVFCEWRKNEMRDEFGFCS